MLTPTATVDYFYFYSFCFIRFVACTLKLCYKGYLHLGLLCPRYIEPFFIRKYLSLSLTVFLVLKFPLVLTKHFQLSFVWDFHNIFFSALLILAICVFIYKGSLKKIKSENLFFLIGVFGLCT